ncbi:MAG: PTS sugar transporter subunit IIB [Angelakisella sp.]|jgi:PTS system galactitol-specific IIB component|nr:PTS sugar transporter subunit IIB [Angelakisella sp.]
MAKKPKIPVKILSICGSGVVTSSMVANKIVELLGDEGYDVSTVEANPSELEGYCMREKFDLIAYSSPIGDPCGVPALNAIGLITGMGEEEFVEQAIEIFKKAGK